MFFLRTARQSGLARSIASSTSSPTSAVAGRRFASGDYGSGATKSGEPNPAVDKEHPGPPPPSGAQQGKGDQQGSEASKQNNSSSNSSTSKPQPKILDQNPPAEGEQSEEVARHNREMAQRADKPHEKVKNEDAEKDKVPKGFWKGTGGRDAEA